MSTVYLIHFGSHQDGQWTSTPYKHAAHYLGYTARSLKTRLAEHRSGRGARLMEVVTEAGISWECVREWKGGTRKLERRLKKQKNTTRRLCPVCRARIRRTITNN